MAKEFSLDDIDFQKKETEDIEKLPFVKPSTTVAIETMGIFQGDSQANIETHMECEASEEPKPVVVALIIICQDWWGTKSLNIFTADRRQNR